MGESINPYDCSNPGNLFTGYDRVRRKMIGGLRNGNSYALLGGRRCGKTSFLLQLEKDLNQAASNAFRPLPRLFDMQAVVPRSTGDFFEAIYALTMQDVSDTATSIVHYQSFLAHLDKAIPLLDQKWGVHWIIVLLVDELESAMERLNDSECLENLRSFLMVSRHRRHFRVVVSGVFSPAEIVSKGSPLNNLTPEYLAVLSGEDSRKLINAGFEDRISSQLEAMLFDITGRHPYMLQGVLAYLHDYDEVSESSLRAAARRFLRDRDGTFRSWLATFRAEGCALYQGMLDGSVRDVPITNALAILSYHGVIDESADSGPTIGSRLFADWFRANYRLEKPSVTLPVEPAKAAVQRRGKQVFVVHGRNMRIRASLFLFLKTLGLKPLDWTELVEATGNPTPHINEILKAGFKIAGSAVVLLTPDDEARVREEFRQPDDPDYELTLSPQPRPNVLFEAGMAMAHFPDRTVLVQVGWSRPFSDIAGIHSIRIDNSIEKRRELARRLKLAGCEILDLDSNISWHDAGDFSLEAYKATQAR